MDRLKAKRSSRRAQVTRYVNETEAIFATEPDNITKLHSMLQKLTACNIELAAINEQLEENFTPEELETEYAAAVEYSDKAVDYITRVRRAIEELERALTSAAPSASATDAAEREATPRGSFSNTSGLRLPRLELPIFKGDISHWRAFWEQYETTIHNNESLSTVEKFNYLRRYLAGEAASAIAGLPTTEACYCNAVETLKQRYGDRRRIEQQHLSALRCLPLVKSVTDTKGLRKLYDTTQLHVRCLAAIGVSTIGYSAMLCDILQKALPYETVLEYHRRESLKDMFGQPSQAVRAAETSSAPPSESCIKLQEFLQFLRMEVENREKSGALSDHQRRSLPETEVVQPSAAVLHSAAKTADECYLCKSTKHITASCSKEATVAEKRKKLAKDMRCFRCTTKGHRARQCYKNIVCATCNGRHATAMCDPKYTQTEEKRACKNDETTVCVSSTAARTGRKEQHNGKDKDQGVYLQTFRSWILNDTGSRYIRGIIDGGSQRTFIKEELATRLHLKVLRSTKTTLNTFASNELTVVNNSKVVEVRVRSQFQNVECVIEATTIPVICQDIAAIRGDTTFLRKLREEKRNIADDVMFPGVSSEAGIGLLIGSDQLWKIVTGEIMRSDEVPGLVAIDTMVGWTLQGPARQGSLSDGNQALVCVLRASGWTEEESTSEVLRSFWDLDTMGISQTEITEKGDQILERFESEIQKKGSRYEVALPWKGGAEQILEDNRAIAMSRLKCLLKRLSRNESLLHRYDDVIRQYLLSGHAEVVPEPKKVDQKVVYYMPHKEVLRETSLTTKLRVVFDASSHAPDSKSLNDCLETGPNLNPDLLAVLIRFRWYPVALIADIEKAFLQIGVKEEDRDAFRFVWFKREPRQPFREDMLEEWRMTRVPFGSTASSFMLTATLQYHLKNERDESQLAEKLMRSFYVDDLLTGANTADEAELMYDKAKTILAKAGMPLRKWATNNKQLQEIFDNEEPDIMTEGQAVKMSRETKVLGMGWNMDSDNFRYVTDSLMSFLVEQLDTKRFVLRATSRIYDPLGLVAPFVLKAKLLFQKLWVLHLDWDDKLPPDLVNEWRTWTADLASLCSLVIPRRVHCWTCENQRDIEVHVFVDASEKAYGACAYLKSKDGQGFFHSVLLVAKSRVAPIKTLTLPQLELMGAVIGARLYDYIMKTYSDISLTYFMWSDSTVTLSWIQGDPQRWKTFVRNRVVEIQNLTDPKNWKFCPGEMNPADMLTRGVTMDVLKTSGVWWQGPNWLKLDRPAWPKVTADKRKQAGAVNEWENCVVLGATERVKASVLEVDRYSTLAKLLKVTAWILRFAHNARGRSRRKGPLSAEEWNEAEKYWIVQVQKEAFLQEVNAIERSLCLDNRSELLELHPFLDDQKILRVGGRLERLDEDTDVKHPILLPNGHKFTQLIVVDAHNRCLHGGVANTMNQLRSRFWVTRARQLVKKITRSCLVCSRERITSTSAPYAPLPPDRIAESKPFNVTGVDFAGPLFAKEGRAGSSKAYIVLFTCATTRAVHLELATSLSTPVFLLAFRRFVSRRGVPETIYSDNGRTFKKASKDLQQIWDIMRQEEFKAYFAQKRIGWKFIVEGAPWWGGWWERMVRTVKTALRKVLGRSSLTFQELETLLCEVEAVVNSRPLTYLYTSAQEPSPISPAHFLVGRQLTVLPETATSEGVVDSSSTRSVALRKLGYRQRLVEGFWRRWKKEYLLQLRTAHRSPKGTARTLELGDVVLVEDSMRPRCVWILARVIQTLPGKDGHVRACMVKTADGTLVRRPVEKLYRMEID